MDRFPGGNCDSFVIKYTIDLNIKNWTTTAIKWSDWDGNSHFSSKPISIPPLAARFWKHSLPSLIALVDRASPQSSLFFTGTIDDHSKDQEEIDTEWTSIEILVYLNQQSHQDETKVRIMELIFCLF